MNDASKFRPMSIVNLTPGLVERGKIKIGKKGASRQSQGGGTYQMPQKLDHFIVTTTERGQDGNFLPDHKIMERLGSSPRRIPVRMIYDDIPLNFSSRYASYAGKTLACTGNGSEAKRLDAKGNWTMCQCPCPRQEPTYQGKDKCKITGTLSAVIDGAGVVGGVWKLRTTSYNTVVGILSSLAMIQRITGGRLAGVPLSLVLTPKTVQDPIQGNQQTIYVVSLEFEGSVEQLRERGYQAMLEDKQHGARIEALEDQARQLLADRTDEYEEDAEDIVDEFYPDAAIEEERQERRTFVSEAEPVPEPEPEPRQRKEPQPDIPPAPPADDGLEDVF